jgi:hypothetical protein
VKGRWYYDPMRGLDRACKDPQQPDPRKLNKHSVTESALVEPKPTKAVKSIGVKRKQVRPAMKKVKEKKKKTAPIEVSASSDDDTSELSDAPTPIPKKRCKLSQSKQLQMPPDELQYPSVPAIPAFPPAPSLSSTTALPSLPIMPQMTANPQTPTSSAMPAIPHAATYAQPGLSASTWRQDIHAFSGLLYDNMRQRLQLEEYARKEAEKKDLEHKTFFQNAFYNSMFMLHPS